MRKWIHICALFPIFSLPLSADPIGLIGGAMNTPEAPYAAYYALDGTLYPLNLGINRGYINDADINFSGVGFIIGQNHDLTPPSHYAAYTYPDLTIQPYTFNLTTNSALQWGGINNNNVAIFVGGQNSGNDPYAGFGTPNAGFTEISLNPNGTLDTCCINDANIAVIAGAGFSNPDGDPYAAIVNIDSSNLSYSLVPVTFPFGQTGFILGSDINSSNTILIGGQKGLMIAPAPYVAFISPSGIATEVTLNTSDGTVDQVALNSFNEALIGGYHASVVTAFASYISPTGTVIDYNIGNLPGGIAAVDINNSGKGIIGLDTDQASGPLAPFYAAFVYPDGTVTPITLPNVDGLIYAVSINDFGQAIIGGSYTPSPAAPFAAIVDEHGVATVLNLNLSAGSIGGTTILPVFSSLPTVDLIGNNLIFADYLNGCALREAFYFIPAIVEGSLTSALEAAAPTRNATSFYTATNNLFYLTTAYSTYSRRHSLPSSPNAETQKQPSRSFWIEGIGAFGYQSRQKQTPAYNSSTGGFISGYDVQLSEQLFLGGGFAYLFTHIDEKQNAGLSNINQEDLYLYACWQKRNLYIDTALWGGLFQTHQVRDIHITSFDFQSTSNPNGGHLAPHLEMGYNYALPIQTTHTFLINPFWMVDWANAWQGSYSESGNSPFNIHQYAQYGSALRAELGIRFYETFHFSSWNLILEEKGSYVNLQSFGLGNLNAAFVGYVCDFTVYTFTQPLNLGVVQGMITIEPLNSKYPSLTAFYQGEFSKYAFTNQVDAGLSWSF